MAGCKKKKRMVVDTGNGVDNTHARLTLQLQLSYPTFVTRPSTTSHGNIHMSTGEIDLGI